MMDRRFIHEGPVWSAYNIDAIDYDSPEDLSGITIAEGTFKKDGILHSITIRLDYLDNEYSMDSKDLGFTFILDEKETSKLTLRIEKNNLEIKNVFTGSQRNFKGTGLGTIAFESIIKPLVIKLGGEVILSPRNVTNKNAQSFYLKEQLLNNDGMMVWQNKSLTLAETKEWIEKLENAGFCYSDLPMSGGLHDGRSEKLTQQLNDKEI